MGLCQVDIDEVGANCEGARTVTVDHGDKAYLVNRYRNFKLAP
jgi:hypothetical protein